MNKEKICQNCKFITKKNTAGWCRDKEDFTARKATCSEFKKK